MQKVKIQEHNSDSLITGRPPQKTFLGKEDYGIWRVSVSMGEYTSFKRGNKRRSGRRGRRTRWRRRRRDGEEGDANKKQKGKGLDRKKGEEKWKTANIKKEKVMRRVDRLKILENMIEIYGEKRRESVSEERWEGGVNVRERENELMMIWSGKSVGGGGAGSEWGNCDSTKLHLFKLGKKAPQIPFQVSLY